MRRWLLLTLSLLATSSFSFAHEVEQHFMRLLLENDHFAARLEMDAGYALPELRSTEDETRPTGEWFANLPDSEKERIKIEGQLYLSEILKFHLDGEPLEHTISFAKWGTDWGQYFEQRPDTFQRMVWDVRWDYENRNGHLELFWNEREEGPSLALQTVSNGRALDLVTVSQHETYSLAAIDGSSQAAPVAATHQPSFFAWLKLGIEHVVPMGLDHILFILGIFLLTPKLKPLLTQSLVFTLAHTITLGLTVAQIIPVNPRIIEPLIALSIAYVAIENLFIKELKPWRLGLIFALGLLHGMGFGSVMSELPVDRSALIVPILGFNLGVEVAQVAILLTALGLTYWWQDRKPYQWLRISASIAIALTGLIWTIQRVM
ncbi:HupE/UreJ family protein [Roseibacillus persicicus]|uniref:HupE/UreJ family protein n=1 Tax=Roseibacillus persicicus TaxID=454148 RepID=UPI00398B0FD9